MSYYFTDYLVRYFLFVEIVSSCRVRLGRVSGRPLTNEMSPVCRGGPRGRPLVRVLSGVLIQFNPAAGAAR